MKKIISVLNDFDKVDDLLQIAIMLTQEHDAVLEVIYVHEAPLFDIPDYFRLDESTKKSLIDKNKIIKEIQDRVSNLGFEKECAVLAFVDDTVDRVLTQIKDDEDTLIITPYHKKITKHLVKKSHLPVLVVKNSIKDYKKIVLPVDLGDNTHKCIDLANTIFPDANKRLLHDYRYVIDAALIDIDYLGMPTSEPILNTQINQELKKSQLENFEALKKETGLEGDFIEESLTIEDDLSQFINVSHFDLTILYSGDKKFLLSNSVSFSLLETLTTDILIQQE